MFRPMIKREHRPVRFGDDLVRIGGSVPGIGADIPDPDGWVWALVGLLDGTRTVDQVVAELVHRFPARPAEDVRTEVRSDLATLVEAGYVEDAAAGPPEGLSAAQRERYSRGRGLWRWMDRSPHLSSWEVQLRLHQARVVVIGLGGVGSTAALSLALSGVGAVHCVEPDVVELSNLNRQVLFTERDVGSLKVEVGVSRLREYNSEVEITGEAMSVTGPQMVARLAVRFDVVVLAADRPWQIRSWTNQACVQTGTAWVHGGYHGPQVSLGVYRPGTGPCYDCAYVAERERLADLPPRVPAASPRESRRAIRAQAANAVSAGVAGHFLAHAAMSLITDVPRLRVNCEYGLNLVALDDSVALGLPQPRPDCPTCAHHTRPVP